MPVFVSYYHEDRTVARTVQSRLQDQWKIATFLDVLDPSLRGAADVTTVILDRLASCTHLIAIISSVTINSWWVPFEIGAATKGDSRIASYNATGRPRLDLPDYLKTWPVVQGLSEIDAFARLYLNDRAQFERNHRLTEAKSAQIQTATDFHRLLKASIGQR